MKYAYIDNENHIFSVSLMCRLMKISRAGYYRWKDRVPSKRYTRRQMVQSAVKQTYFRFKARYGAPGITEELNEMGISCSKNHVAALLKESGLKARNGRNFRYRSAGNKNHNVMENLLKRNFTAQRPNQKWVSDITYINVNGKWLYLAVVMDLFSRAIVGWALDTLVTEQLITDALDMAISRRKVEKELIVHSDRGVQYRANCYQDKLNMHGCRISMSRLGNCWDNSAMESFFSRLKVELIFAEKFRTIEEAKSAIFEYIEVFYNRIRKHSANGYVSPMQFEKLCA